MVYSKNLEDWKAIRSQTQDVDEAIKLFLIINTLRKVNDEKKWLKVSDFDQPQIVTILDFKKVEGGKYVNKWGFSNQLTMLYSGVERALDNSSYAFSLAFKNAGLRSGDRAMVCTVGFTDPQTEKIYRYWIMEKLDKTSEEPAI